MKLHAETSSTDNGPQLSETYLLRIQMSSVECRSQGNDGTVPSVGQYIDQCTELRGDFLPAQDPLLVQKYLF